MTDVSCLPFEHLIFDFDGVILDSATLKTRAFASVYENEPADLIAQVTEYQEAHGGIGRREKFAHFEQDVFGREASPIVLDALCCRFAVIVDEGMRRARYVPGILRLLERLHGCVHMHVVSGMPHSDLVRICAERNLTNYFDRLIGTPTTKPVAFEEILDRAGSSPGNILAIGDSTTEFAAARRLGIPFLAIIPEYGADRFPAELRRLQDFSDLKSALFEMTRAMSNI